MSYAAKLVYNNLNWVRPTGLVPPDVGIKVPNTNFCFGLEEWINNDLLKQRKLGYIDCYRGKAYPDETDVLLLTFDKNSRSVYVVGVLYAVQQLQDKEIDEIRNALGQNWRNSILADFEQIEDINPNHTYDLYHANSWTSNSIVASRGEGFIVNIKYKRLKLFSQENWLNLTAFDRGINRRWNRITDRYIIDRLLNNHNIDHSLKESLRNLLNILNLKITL